jgi:hypothetical protein
MLRKIFLPRTGSNGGWRKLCDGNLYNLYMDSSSAIFGVIKSRRNTWGGGPCNTHGTDEKKHDKF